MPYPLDCASVSDSQVAAGWKLGWWQVGGEVSAAVGDGRVGLHLLAMKADVVKEFREGRQSNE